MCDFQTLHPVDIDEANTFSTIRRANENLKRISWIKSRIQSNLFPQLEENFIDDQESV